MACPYKNSPPDGDSAPIIAQLPRPARGGQAAEGFAPALADALARQAELLPNLFQRVGAAVVQAEAQPQDARFARAERREDLFDLLPQQGRIRGLSRRRG